MFKHHIIVLTTIGFASVPMIGATDDHRPPMEKVFWDTVTKSGEFTGGNLYMPTQPKEGLIRGGIAGVTTLIYNGSPSNRIDLVFVGDGYTVSDLSAYESHVNTAVNAFFGIEPLQSYLPLFNVHRVDVISNESGVDNDPVNGINRDTAMDMEFWCSGIERLLCVNTSLAWGFANNVPSTDAILAVANSSMYGGAGYSWAEIGTFAGANSAATEIAIHEIGHSLANLADEYDYGGSEYYTGPEPSERNASTYTAAQMAANGTKWAAWLGENDSAWDGYVGTYEGAYYSLYDIYRPTNNSMMRALNRPFNQPSAESFIIEMYSIVNPIDTSTPSGTQDETSVVEIGPIDVGHPMEIHWYINGKLLPKDGATSVSISSLGLPLGTHALSVTVVDPTDWVRDEQARDTIMKQSLSWPILIDELICESDITGDGSVNIADLLLVINQWGTCTGCSADINADNVVNVNDLLLVVAAWGPCPS